MIKLKSFLAIILVSFGLAFQCVRRECCVTPPCSDKATLEGSWRLIGIRSNTTGKLDSLPSSENRRVIFTFKDDEKSGTIDGHTFVNTISGTYEMLDYCRFKVLSFGGTKVGEPGLSGKAWLTSETIYHYERKGNSLAIQPQMAVEALIFIKN